MANGWTLESRQQQSKMIRQWKPWEKSTGPKSNEGKSKVAMNAYKGSFSPRLRMLARALKSQQKMKNGDGHFLSG